jgi:hypothetical protein
MDRRYFHFIEYFYNIYVFFYLKTLSGFREKNQKITYPKIEANDIPKTLQYLFDTYND